MAPLKLIASYGSAADLAAHLQEQLEQGALLLRDPQLAESAAGIQQFQEVALTLRQGVEEVPLQAEVLQVIPSLGLAVRLKEPGAAFALTHGEDPAPSPTPPVIAHGDTDGGAAAGADADKAEDEDEVKPGSAKDLRRRGSGPLSWPFEKLQMEWGNLPIHEKVRVAKYGKRPARGMILKGHDKMLHNFLLQNPHITPDEVGMMASMVSLDPNLLRRIAASPEWSRHKVVARNLVCHPKMTLPEVTKLARTLSNDEMRRLTRTGKVRASVKRVLIKLVEQRAGRR
jgi:hypothetical protein